MLRWQDWRTQALGDQSAAEDLFRTGHWAWCCFACHQAAEKFLKAALEARRVPHEGHSLPTLVRNLSQAVDHPMPDPVMAACRALNRLYIPTRYPDAHQEGAPVELYGERDARSALQDLREVVQFLEQAGGPPSA
jgi:HEPN domain-containing protein